MASIAYDDITTLTDDEVQMLLREVDTKDLAVVMLGSSEAINAQYFANVSDRVAGMLRAEMTAIGTPLSDDLDRIKYGITQTLGQLHEAGVIAWPK